MRPTMVKMDGYMYLSIPQRGNLLDARIRWGKDAEWRCPFPRNTTDEQSSGVTFGSENPSRKHR